MMDAAALDDSAPDEAACHRQQHRHQQEASTKQALQQLVKEHVQREVVNEKIRACVRDIAVEKGGNMSELTSSEIREKLRSKGLIDEVLASLGVDDRATAAQYVAQNKDTSMRSQSTNATANASTTQTTTSTAASRRDAHFISKATRSSQKALYLSIHGGSAFIEQQDHASSTLSIHIRFRNQRFVSDDYECACEPGFQEGFVLNLPAFSEAVSTGVGSLFDIRDPIHILVLRKDKDDAYGRVIGSHHLDFRPTLLRGMLEARSPIKSVKVHGVGAHSHLPTGILHIKMQLTPSQHMNIDAEEVAVALTQEKEQQSLKKRQFLVHAQRWWEEYTSIRSSHSKRLVKLFVTDESGDRIPVCCCVHRVSPGRYIDTPTAAARFVSLLSFVKRDTDICANVGASHGHLDQWNSLHATLATKQGDVEDHALLLAGLFLAFGLDAHVCIGTKVKGRRGRGGGFSGADDEEEDEDLPLTDEFLVRQKMREIERQQEEMYMWVMVLDGDGYAWFWDPVSGTRYKHFDAHDERHLDETPRHPFVTLDCVFNDTCFLANSQPSHFISECSFDLSNNKFWKPLSGDLIANTRQLYPQHTLTLSRPRLDPQQVADDFEVELQALIKEYRHREGLTTRFDGDLAQVLSPALFAYEEEQLMGMSGANATLESQGGGLGKAYLGHLSTDFQLAIRHRIPAGHSFKGFPFEMRNSLSPSEALQMCLDNYVGKEVLGIHGDQVYHTVRCKACVFPEGLATLWVMVACRYLSIA